MARVTNEGPRRALGVRRAALDMPSVDQVLDGVDHEKMRFATVSGEERITRHTNGVFVEQLVEGSVEAESIESRAN